jgi:hypothetical protein
MSGHEWEIAILLVGAVLAWWSRRQGDREAAERAEREEQRKDTGKRIGVVEEWMNIERGRDLERKRKDPRGSNEQ